MHVNPCATLLTSLVDAVITGYETPFCNVRAEEKSAKVLVEKVAEKATSPLELVYADLLGPMQTPSLGGHMYAIGVVDSYSRFGVCVACIGNLMRCLRSRLL